MQSSTQRSAIDQTLDVSPIDSPHVPSDRHAVAIVEGSAPELSRATNDLLRQRLRIASLLLFAGFFAFFIKGLFHLDQLSTQLDLVIF